MCDQYNAGSGLTAKIEVFGIILVEHGSGYVGHVPARITFTT